MIDLGTTPPPNAKPISDGPMRELTVEELRLQADANRYLAERVRRAVAWAVDHDPYANVSQIDRVLTAIDFVTHQAITDLDQLIAARKARRSGDDAEIPF